MSKATLAPADPAARPYFEELPQGKVRTHIPRDRNEAMLVVAEGKRVRLTGLKRAYWPELSLSKAALLQYYLDVAPALLPHVQGCAVLLKRYPNGAAGKFFLMKRAPVPRPTWVRICREPPTSGTVLELPLIDDAASLASIINLGCIEILPMEAPKGDLLRPDVLELDLDGGQVEFAKVREVALFAREALAALRIPVYPKTSGDGGLHLYVPIVRGPTQHEVWAVAKAIAREIAERHPRIATLDPRAKGPAGRVFIDYTQNAWGKALPAPYSVRATPVATVSTPLAWNEVEAGITPGELRVDTVPGRLTRRGDLWAPLAPGAGERFDIRQLM